MSRLASSKRMPCAKRSASTSSPSAPGAREREGELRRVVGVDDREALDLPEPLADEGGKAQRLGEELLPAHRHDLARPVEAGEQRRGDARRVEELEGLVQAREVEPLAAREQVGTLRERGQSLVRRGDEPVRAERDRVRRQIGVKPEVGAPGLVDDERDAGRVGELGDARKVGEDADEVGLDKEHAARVGRRGQGVRNPLGR